ncbi:MAG: Mpo1-like protein [Fulvivirga sp.]|nr:Mpo1-like protein [Fulvivirga sp.]
MRRIDQLLQEYGDSHQNQTNKLIHWICVPLIFLSVVGFIWSIPSIFIQEILSYHNPYLNWASIILGVVVFYYLSLSWQLGLGMAVFSVICLFIVRQVELLGIAPVWQIALIVFVLAWIGQFYGHKVEGKKPSFFKDLQFLLIGPAWLMHFIYKKLDIPY